MSRSWPCFALTGLLGLVATAGLTAPDTPPPTVAAPATALVPGGVPDANASSGLRPSMPASALPPASISLVDPQRFGQRPADAAYGAFQRGYYKTAFDLALPRAEGGDGAAQTLVAEILSMGLGVRQNGREAVAWYGKAADNGVPEAQFQYAMVLMEGRLAPKDEARATDLLRRAADAGHRLAQFNLAQRLVRLQPGPAGFAKAGPYYEKAAEAGLADAQYAMAEVEGEGLAGRPADPARSRAWLEKAARQNYDTAQLDLATLLVEGKGGLADEKAGFGWMRRAAESGNPAARNRLAKLYVNAIGTDGDPVAAATWYLLARRSGLTDPEMDDFLDGLTEAQLAQARERAKSLH